jgi:3-oxoadipate enol-lactonase
MNLSYTMKGSSDNLPLVLIHAFPLNKAMWRHQLEDLSDIACVIAPDTPGFGESPVLSEPPTMNAYVKKFQDLLSSLNIEKAVFCGCSMGGYILFELWRQCPERVAGLILCDTRAEADGEEARKKRENSIEQVNAQGTQATAEAMLPVLAGQHTRQNRQALVEEIKTSS